MECPVPWSVCIYNGLSWLGCLVAKFTRSIATTGICVHFCQQPSTYIRLQAGFEQRFTNPGLRLSLIYGSTCLPPKRTDMTVHRLGFEPGISSSKTTSPICLSIKPPNAYSTSFFCIMNTVNDVYLEEIVRCASHHLEEHADHVKQYCCQQW